MDSPPDPLMTSSSLDSPTKRKASVAGLDGTPPTRPVKRRASKACQCCRTRKVRCNVTEHGAPCTNCRLDEVECIVSESRRKKYVAATLRINGAAELILTCGLQEVEQGWCCWGTRPASRTTWPTRQCLGCLQVCWTKNRISKFSACIAKWPP